MATENKYKVWQNWCFGHGRRKVHKSMLVIWAAQRGTNGQLSCLHSFKIYEIIIQWNDIVCGTFWRIKKIYDNFENVLLCKSSIWFTVKQIFRLIPYFLNKLKCAANYRSFNLRHMMVSDFEAMKAGKLAIWSSLRWQYSENTLMNLLSSVSPLIFAVPQKLQKLSASKIKYKKFGPKVLFPH